MRSSLPSDFNLDSAASFDEGIDLINKNRYNVILIDIYLDGKCGFDIIEFIKKKEFIQIPTIMIITASSREEDEIRGHMLEVAEYIKKPIKPQVFRTIMEKYSIKPKSDQNHLKRIGPLMVDSLKMQVKFIFDSNTDEDIPLTLKEYKLLLKFLNNPRIPYSREQLFTDVWDSSSEMQSRTIDMHISTLRKKLGVFGQSIASVRGVGYVFDPH